ncbi:unnamed protein product [Blepharisma stoltei]|uniref:Uncharacterized protein n=1 Tax=Blepharisma stoltei TaxID=1481888 RepID=A0AAU9K9D1_9CILI|nr:unnamed protein product [Blepharisma stoltei]
MPIPGVYFIGKCTQPDCTYYLRQVPLYVGSQGTFDIARVKNVCQCGGCSNPISKIVNILFVNCTWTFKGKLQSGERKTLEEERVVDKLEYFPFTKDVIWDWLVIKVRPNQPTPQTRQEKEVAHMSVQTDQTESIPTMSLDKVIIDALTKQAKKYCDKYYKVKAELKSFMKKAKIEEFNFK